MSSRNKYLDGDLRKQAVVLWQAIQRARARVHGSRSVAAGKLKADLKTFIETQPAARFDYVEFFDPETLAPMTQVKSGDSNGAGGVRRKDAID